MNSAKCPRSVYFSMLIFVAVIWGIDPILNDYLYNYYSAAALSTFATFLTALLFLILSLKKLKYLNMDYVKTALPISLFNSVGCVLQKIGLQYTTPAKYAFLEHISCIVVPVAMLIIMKKKPDKWQWISGGICLIGCILLTGVGKESTSLGIGEILCGTAGIIFGFCIVAISTYTIKLDIDLFMSVHMLVYFLTSATMAIALNFININSAPIERFIFSFKPLHLIGAALVGIISVGVCWLMRTEATRHLSPSTVAVVAPLSAIISGVVSVCLGTDSFNTPFLVSAVMIVSAAIISGGSEVRPNK